MMSGSRIIPAVLGMLLLACISGTAAAASLGTDWKARPYTDAPFSGVKFSDDGNMVFATGDQLLLRSWDGSRKWGGRSGTVAAMSGNAEFVVDGIGTSLIMLDKTMVDNWSRNMNGQVKAVAISKNGSFVISADDQGLYTSWAMNGDFYGRTTDDPVKHLALSPTENIIAATTQNGLRIYTPIFEPVWSDNKSSSLDDRILISGDGRTIITAGANRLSSHSSTGTVNWVVYPSTNDIIDMACNQDCSAIVLGTQDSTIVAIDRYGKTRWTYKAKQWVNAVGISQYGTVIGAGGLDGTVYVLDRAGKVQTQKKMDSGIRPRSLAVSPDGTRIAVADQINLYGLSILGDTSPGVMETFTPPPLDPVRASQVPTTIVPVETPPPVTPELTAAESPVPQSTTQKSDAGFVPVLLAWAAIIVAIWAIRR